MGWYGIDAVDAAIKRTKKALIEPFDFWKWIKLGIIVFFIGGGGTGISNFNPPASYQRQYEGTKIPSTEEIFNQVSQFWHQYQIYILIAIAIIIFIILLFTFISSVMEFVFVESVVTNHVAIRAYFSKYLRPGFNLFIIQVILMVVFLSLFILAMIPLLQRFLSGAVTPGLILGSILWFFGVVFIFAILSGIIRSFISLAIPIAMYQGVGITTAIKNVFGRFMEDWKQVAVYWVVRIIIIIVAVIIVGIAALILFIVVFLVLLVPALILYFILSGLGQGISSPLFWIVMIPYGLLAVIVFILLILLVSVPVPVFMKYHLLTFMQAWYPDVTVPLFDSERTGVQYS
ncbi:MAG: hypothetical protein OIN66_14610 [Candidatus Methanoperedens sp.]|nr:hypothetical protein [Candidatus Methanoperedens sp.]